MGAMNCSRKDCGSPMCDIYVSEVGYVCYECRKEFEAYVETLRTKPQTEREFVLALQQFFKSPKGSLDPKAPKIDIHEFFNKHSR